MCDVIRFSPRFSDRHQDDEAVLRRLAIQIASQLPADATEAMAVLERAKWLVEAFLTVKA